jgi:hypothetical protein
VFAPFAVSSSAAVFAPVSGSSAAATIRGTSGVDHLIGTAQPDVLLGLGSGDYLESRRGDDFLNGGNGADTVFAGAGADRTEAAFDGSTDGVSCGLGRDVVVAEPLDEVAGDCEITSRQLSRDTLGQRPAQPGTEVEPDSEARGRVVVSAYQIGRFFDGGALAIGFSTSRDSGRTWRSGLLPRLTRSSRPAGAATFAADPSVAYDAAHKLWLIASLAALPASDAILVSRSKNGIDWSAPIRALDSTTGMDKTWIECDNWRQSRFFGRCYLAYRDGNPGRILTARSTNGARTWSRPVEVAAGALSKRSLNGAIPVIRPDGMLIVAFTVNSGTFRGPDGIGAARSTDGGVTFGPEQQVAVVPRTTLTFFDVRAPQFVSGDVDAAGTVYLAWQGCTKSPCEDAEIMLSTSVDGSDWSTPVRLPTAPEEAHLQSFLPALAVEPGTRGLHARLTLVYYTMDCGRLACPVDAGVISSADGGRTWGPPQRLSVQPIPLEWLANTNQGRMLGDYVSVSYADGRAVGVFALATAPANAHLNEAIFAVRVPR